MNQKQAPLFDILVKHAQEAKGNFHVPGHKQGQAFDSEGATYFTPLLNIDLTELPGLDDLHEPTGPIQDAQKLAAQAFGAQQTFFLVGGTTAGNLAAILSIAHPGDFILVERNAHQSVFHGCMLARARPIYLGTTSDSSGLLQGIQPEVLEEALRRFPGIKGVVITHPNYYGVTQPLDEIVSLCHKYGIPLVVDEAHGAHFGFHPELPKSALQYGADLVIQSTHKMLPSMTMSSMLHLQGDRISVTSLQHWLKVIQSSSPSYPLMASLDLARRYIVTDGKERLNDVLHRLKHLRKELKALCYLRETPLGERRDPFKLTLEAVRRISGYRLERFLREKGCYVELADHRRILFAFSMGTSDAEVEYLLETLKELDREIPFMKEEPPLKPPSVPRWSVSPKPLDEYIRAKHITVSLEDAVHKISSAMILPYPPGIPLVLPGEQFSSDAVDFLQKVVQAGGKVRGMRNSQQSVDVIE